MSVSFSRRLLDQIELLIPKSSVGAYKGQAGKLTVIGGCKEYTGAPYFASMTALKMVRLMHRLIYDDLTLFESPIRAVI